MRAGGSALKATKSVWKPMLGTPLLNPSRFAIRSPSAKRLLIVTPVQWYMSEELAWTTLRSETAYSCPGFEVRHDEVRLPNGTETEYHYVVEPESVVILPFTTDREVVVIDEWRQAVDRVNRGLPAGNVEPNDDDLAAAAHRELTEETGYVADEVEHLLTVEPANGIVNAVHHYFVGRDCLRNGEQDLDGNESIHVNTTTLDRLRSQALDGTVRDGRAVLAVLYYDALWPEG